MWLSLGKDLGLERTAFFPLVLLPSNYMLKKYIDIHKLKGSKQKALHVSDGNVENWKVWNLALTVQESNCCVSFLFLPQKLTQYTHRILFPNSVGKQLPCVVALLTTEINYNTHIGFCSHTQTSSYNTIYIQISLPTHKYLLYIYTGEEKSCKNWLSVEQTPPEWILTLASSVLREGNK